MGTNQLSAYLLYPTLLVKGLRWWLLGGGRRTGGSGFNTGVLLRLERELDIL